MKARDGKVGEGDSCVEGAGAGTSLIVDAGDGDLCVVDVGASMLPVVGIGDGDLCVAGDWARMSPVGDTEDGFSVVMGAASESVAVGAEAGIGVPRINGKTEGGQVLTRPFILTRLLASGRWEHLLPPLL